MLLKNHQRKDRRADPEKSKDHTLRLTHCFEGKPVVSDFISNTMMGIEYLWGGPVQFETAEVVSVTPSPSQPLGTNGLGATDEEKKITWQQVVYTMENRKLSKKMIEETVH